MKLIKISRSMHWDTPGDKKLHTSAFWMPYGHPLLPALPENLALDQEIIHSAERYQEHHLFFVARGTKHNLGWRWVYMPPVSRAMTQEHHRAEILARERKNLEPLFALGLLERRYPTRQQALQDLEAALLAVEMKTSPEEA